MRPKHLTVITAVFALIGGLLAAPPVAATAPAPSPAAKARGTVSGTVTYRGKPLENAEVEIRGGGFSAFVSTDAQGRFSTKAPPGRYRVSARSIHDVSAHTTWVGGALRKPDAKRVTVREGRTTTVKVALKRAVTIQRRILDAEGKPAVGMRVTATNLVRPQVEAWTTTDSKGRYTLKGLAPGKTEIIPGRWSMDPDVVGRLVMRPRESTQRLTAPDLQLTRVERGTVTVKIKGGKDLDLEVTAHDPGLTTQRWFTRNKKTGLWSALVPVGTWRIAVDGTNLATDPIEVVADAVTHAGTLTIPAKCSKLVVKVFRKNGKPARSELVRVRDALGMPAGAARISKKGRAAIRNLVPGEYSLTSDAPHHTWGHAPAPQLVTVKGKKTTASLRYEEGQSVRGTVRPRGKLLANMDVTLSSRTDWQWSVRNKTDARGGFSFDGVPRDRYRIKVADPYPVYRKTTRSLSVRGDVTDLRIKVKE